MKKNNRDPSSFRDPSGFVFWYDGKLFRQVNQTYQGNYDYLMSSGLYKNLVDRKLLLPHCEVDSDPHSPEISYRVIKPQQIPFISYPYEWSFSQLQDAALTTLKIQMLALNYGMTIKDASAYNIQFWNGKPVLIDTLSFEMYEEGVPWVGYRQFCQHFLAPLAIMSYKDIRLQQLLKIYIDGIPLDLASTLLPIQTYINLSLLIHLHLHAMAQKRFAQQPVDTTSPKRLMNRKGMEGIIESLEAVIRKLNWNPSKTKWSNYTKSHNYSVTALKHKKQIVNGYLDKVKPESVWDLGANVGHFSRLASQRKIKTIAFDIDPGAVEINYQKCKEDGDKHLLPLVMDLTNPSPGIGWQNNERQALIERSSPDMIIALALVHHLAIANNIPLEKIAEYFKSIGKWLIIEFIPKDDPQTRKLLTSRDDIFLNYSKSNFESTFGTTYEIVDITPLKESNRIIYLMKRIDSSYTR